MNECGGPKSSGNSRTANSRTTSAKYSQYNVATSIGRKRSVSHGSSRRQSPRVKLMRSSYMSCQLPCSCANRNVKPAFCVLRVLVRVEDLANTGRVTDSKTSRQRVSSSEMLPGALSSRPPLAFDTLAAASLSHRAVPTPAKAGPADLSSRMAANVGLYSQISGR